MCRIRDTDNDIYGNSINWHVRLNAKAIIEVVNSFCEHCGEDLTPMEQKIRYCSNCDRDIEIIRADQIF